jgi:hypothetical protein
MAKNQIPPELQDEIYKLYVEDSALRTVDIQNWLKSNHNIRVDSRTVSNVLRRYQSLREKEMREHIKDKVTPYIAKDLERLSESKAMMHNAIRMMYVQFTTEKDFKLATPFAKLINEERQSIALSMQLAGAYTVEKPADQDSYSDEAVTKILTHLEKLNPTPEKIIKNKGSN